LTAPLRTKTTWVTDAEGNRVRMLRPVKLRQWWTVGAAGTVQFGVRYGAVPVQLQQGKTPLNLLLIISAWSDLTRGYRARRRKWNAGSGTCRRGAV
jgi:hypothetical protein